MNTIPGPYKFGFEPPRHLMGWLKPEVEKAIEEGDKFQSPFEIINQSNPQVPPPIWTLTKSINNGQHLPTFEQAIGDCVAAGIRHAGARLQVAEIVAQYQEEVLRPWYVPFIYGISRVQIGGGQIDGDGSTGTWGAAAVKRYGVLFDQDFDVPKYSAAVAREWGRRPGPPAKHLIRAAPRTVLTTSRLRSIDQVREALCNYYPITVASSQGFKMEPVERDGFHIFVRSGTWMHQMALIAWMDEPFPAAYRLNSWGPHAHGTPLNDEPPGGAWCTANVLEEELTWRDTEVYTYSNFEGYPSAPNRGLIR